MSSLTGINANQAAVSASFTGLRDSLPPTSDLLSFGAAHQIAIQRLAKTYCGAVVTDAGTCVDFFGACQIDGNAKDQVAAVLYERFIGDNIANQPEQADVTAEIVDESNREDSASEDVIRKASTVLLEEILKRLPTDVTTGSHLLGVTAPTFRTRTAELKRRKASAS